MVEHPALCIFAACKCTCAHKVRACPSPASLSSCVYRMAVPCVVRGLGAFFPVSCVGPGRFLCDALHTPLPALSVARVLRPTAHLDDEDDTVEAFFSADAAVTTSEASPLACEGATTLVCFIVAVVCRNNRR